MSDTIRWGLIGLGSIARRFGSCFQYAPGAEIYAVASRSQENADAFGAEFGAAKRYSSYEALVNDPNVDVVYIGTPHNFHRAHTLLSLNAGKPVLCEKPFAVNAAEAQDMIERAREKNLFLMDAFWTRYFPAMGKLRELLAEKGHRRCHAGYCRLWFSRTGHSGETPLQSRSGRRRFTRCRRLLHPVRFHGLWQVSRLKSPPNTRSVRPALTNSRQCCSNTATTKWRDSLRRSA